MFLLRGEKKLKRNEAHSAQRMNVIYIMYTPVKQRRRAEAAERGQRGLEVVYGAFIYLRMNEKKKCFHKYIF